MVKTVNSQDDIDVWSVRVPSYNSKGQSMKPPPKKARTRAAENSTDEPQAIDPKDDRMQFVAPGQKRCGLKVLVATSSHLELQSFNLCDVIYECQNVAVELLANLIQRSDQERVEFSDFGEKGIRLITNIFRDREPQLKDVLMVDFEVLGQLRDGYAFVTLLFKCRFKSEMSSVLNSNDSALFYMH